MFALRDRVQWQGRRHQESGFRGKRPQTDRGKQLFNTYGLHHYETRWDWDTLREVIGVLDLLDRIPLSVLVEGAGLYSKEALLDVGARNWRYAGALQVWLERYFPEVGEVYGVELDAYRMYSDLKTRASYGEYFARVASTPERDFHYIARDVRDWEKSVGWVTWFFPFLDLYPHKKWGLPKRLFHPAELFSHVHQKTSQNGRWILANYGEVEWMALEKHLRDLKMQCLWHSAPSGLLHPNSQIAQIQISVWK